MNTNVVERAIRTVTMAGSLCTTSLEADPKRSINEQVSPISPSLRRCGGKAGPLFFLTFTSSPESVAGGDEPVGQTSR